MCKPARPNRLAWTAGLLVATCAAWAGCAGAPDGPRNLSSDGLAKVRIRTPGTLYLKPDYPVGGYDDIMVASIGIHYVPGHELAEAQEEMILDRMVATLYEGVAAGFDLAREPGPCTVKMGVYLKDVSFYKSGPSGSQTRFVSSYGAATLVFEFRDSMSGAPLVRYGQRRSIGSGVDAGQVRGLNIELLGETLEQMAQDVGDTLQEVVAPEVAGKAVSGCNGRIGKALANR